MATLDTLTAKVVRRILNPSFTEPDIKDYLNEGVQEISGGMPSSFGDFITPPLPKLFVRETITTDNLTAFISMPSTFQRDLIFVVDAQGNEVDIENSWNEFIEANPGLDRDGRIYTVIEKGHNLYYQGIPAIAENITLHFYRAPVDMVEADNTPDGIPEHLQVSLLVNYACYKIFDAIENGIEENVNTQKYEKMFLNALRTLELTIPYEANSFRQSI